MQDKSCHKKKKKGRKERKKEQTDIHVTKSKHEQARNMCVRNYQNSFETLLSSKVSEVLFLHA